MIRKVSFGKNPRLLIHAGTHGDEWEVIGLVEEAIKKYKTNLPPFIFIPEVSPSAVKIKTRLNKYGNDLNRMFFDETDDPEAIENIKFMVNKHFDLIVSFHEDFEYTAYYIYDTDRIGLEDGRVLKHIKKLKELGIKLFNGIDDTRDPDLGNVFVEGYRKFKHNDEDSNHGMVTSWALDHGIANQGLIPEIPGKLNLNDKKIIVESFFEEVLLKSL